MATATQEKSGRCSNFGNCSIADSRAPVTVLAGMDLVCTECGKQLLLSDGGTTASGSRAGLAIAIVVVLLLLAGGAGFWLLRGGQEKPAPVVAPAPAASPAPVRPANGDCSRTDAERGLCTATSR